MPINIKGNAGQIKFSGASGRLNVPVPVPATPEIPEQYSSYMLSWYRSDSVVLDGSNVVQLLDKSGNGRHLGMDGTPSTVAPSLVTSDVKFNGHDSLLFNGSTQSLTGSIWDLGGASGVGYTFFTVYNYVSNNSTDQVIWQVTADPTNAPGSSYSWIQQDFPTDGKLRFGGSTYLTWTLSGVGYSQYLTTCVATGSWEYSSARVNGSPSVNYPGEYAYVPSQAKPTDISIARFRKDAVKSGWSNIKLAEFLIFSGTLPPEGKAAIESYLASRYGL